MSSSNSDNNGSSSSKIKNVDVNYSYDYDYDSDAAAAAAADDDDDDEAPDLILVTPTTATATATANKEYNKEQQQQQQQQQQKQKPCPVTILCGFLGSGKTTLINYILKSPDHGKRIAVIENEFGGGSGGNSNSNGREGGGLSIESLIARDGIYEQNNNNNNTLQDLIELPNGCICCTVKDTLIVTLELLINKRSDLDYIIIESSGLADPGPIASIFWLDESLESRLHLDGIICMIDSKNILHQIKETEEASKQIAYSDRIVLNKIDLLSNDDDDGNDDDADYDVVNTIENEIRQIHPSVPILRTSFSKIPNLNWILDADCFGGSSRIEEVELSLNGNLLFCTDVVTNNNDDDDANGQNNPPPPLPYNIIPLQHKHTSSISTVSFEINGSIVLKKLNSWLADILWPNQDESDKVLTAMLYQDDNDKQPHDDDSKRPVSEDNDGKTTTKDTTTSSSSTSTTSTSTKTKTDVKTTQQIFRIKGIVSVVHMNSNSNEEDDDDIDDDVVVVEEAGETNYCTTTKQLDPRRYIVQGVYDLWDIHPASGTDLNFKQNEKRIGKIVIIGKYLDEQKLKEGFEACFCS